VQKDYELFRESIGECWPHYVRLFYITRFMVPFTNPKLADTKKQTGTRPTVMDATGEVEVERNAVAVDEDAAEAAMTAKVATLSARRPYNPHHRAPASTSSSSSSGNQQSQAVVPSIPLIPSVIAGTGTASSTTDNSTEGSSLPPSSFPSTKTTEANRGSL
jgi:hypothetical protein